MLLTIGSICDLVITFNHGTAGESVRVNIYSAIEINLLLLSMTSENMKSFSLLDSIISNHFPIYVHFDHAPWDSSHDLIVPFVRSPSENSGGVFDDKIALDAIVEVIITKSTGGKSDCTHPFDATVLWNPDVLLEIFGDVTIENS
jgi:hypothetical protein